MIVKDRELVLVFPNGERTWIGDTEVLPGGSLPAGEYFKVKHQLICDNCQSGVRAQDDHHCSDRT